MGACFPFSSWIAEDDALLKKAVEAGASLESLAKGAVCFSRRFTIRELQERWLALLYDREISAEASARITKLQNSDQNHQKPIRSSNAKGKEMEKRKLDSVRSHYYAMRKKICQDACDPFALDHLLPHGAHFYIENCMSGAPISDHFVLPETGFEIEGQSFPTSVAAAASHSFHTGHVDSLGDGLPDDILARDCLYGFGDDNVSSISVENTANGLKPSLDNVNLQKDIPHILRDDTTVFRNVSGSLPQTLPANDLFGAQDSEAKSLPDFDPINGNLGRVCTGFESSQPFSSRGSDCSAQYQELAYSSPQSSSPIWRTIEEFSAPSMSIEDKEQNSGQKLVDRMHDDGLNHSIVVSEGDFIDLSHSLLNFDNDDILYMNMGGGKDMMDRSSCLDGISSILLSSPNDVHHDDAPKSGDPKASLVLDTGPVIPDGGCAGVVDVIGSSLESGDGNGSTGCGSGLNISATSSRNHDYPSLAICVLNTEDPFIPCNDHIFLPKLVPPIGSSLTQHNSDDITSSALSSAKELSKNWKAGERGLPLIKEEPETLASALASNTSPDMGLKHPSLGHRVKTELPDCDFSSSVSKSSAILGEDPKPCPPVPIAQHSTQISNMKVGISVPELENGDTDSSRPDKPDAGFSQAKSYPLSTIGGCKQESDIPVAEHGSGEMETSEPVASFSNSDQEELLSESEDDVPYFSDVEAMILDMDLGPEDLDSFLAREVARYQNENTKKAIIRLEQGFHSCMRRAASYQGAYAVFYGRYLKYYIKKPEVSLGRATDDVNVDIDLGREGRANKISRRQAIIKMEEDGSFYLKNLGKHGILINNKEVASGQRYKLRSSCLIEIRDMRFIFETNPKRVMHYIANIVKKESQAK